MSATFVQIIRCIQHICRKHPMQQLIQSTWWIFEVDQVLCISCCRCNSYWVVQFRCEQSAGVSGRKWTWHQLLTFCYTCVSGPLLDWLKIGPNRQTMLVRRSSWSRMWSSSLPSVIVQSAFSFSDKEDKIKRSAMHISLDPAALKRFQSNKSLEYFLISTPIFSLSYYFLIGKLSSINHTLHSKVWLDCHNLKFFYPKNSKFHLIFAQNDRNYSVAACPRTPFTFTSSEMGLALLTSHKCWLTAMSHNKWDSRFCFKQPFSQKNCQMVDRPAPYTYFLTS